MSEEYEWIQLGYSREKREGIFYQKREIYQLFDSDWARDTSTSFDISTSLICTGKFGGPIAITRDPSALIIATPNFKNEQVIAIYSCSGKRLSSFEWKVKSVLIAFGWSSKETLICVSDDAKVYLYDIFGRFIKFFSMNKMICDEKILQATVWEGGVVVLTRKFKIWIISKIHGKPKYENPRGTISLDMDEIDNFSEDIKLNVIERKESAVSEYRDVDIYVMVKGDKTITHVSTDQPWSSKTLEYEFEDFTVSPKGKLIAFFTKDNSVWVTESDFIKSAKSPFSDKSIKEPPTQIKWCGENCVCLYFAPKQLAQGGEKSSRSLLVMIGPSSEIKRFYFDGPIYIDTEIDGLKIITTENYEFFHPVPEENRSIFKIGSLDCAAILYDSYLEFEEKKASSIKNIRKIEQKNELKTAVKFCIKAAGNEFNPKQQSKLAKAASYGKSFITSQIKGEEYNYNQEFVNMCKTLRVLNSVRNYTIGIPISYNQYIFLTKEKLIERLINRNHHLLAFKVCDYLSLDQKKKDVLIHWACAKVASDENDHDILQAIKKKCVKSISYAKVAKAAYKHRKKHLASNLLALCQDYPGEQVDLLLEMNTDDDMKNALRKAIQSGETELIRLVLETMRTRFPKELFIKTIFDGEFEVARKFYLSYLKNEKKDFRFLRVCCDISELPHEEAFLDVYESINKNYDIKEKIEYLDKAKKLFSRNSTFYVESKFCDYQIKLLKKQQEYDVLFGKRIFTGLSVIDTVSEVIERDLRDNGMKEAKNLKTQFKINDKNYYYVVINALAKSSKWAGLKKFAESKRPPIGFRPFVDICLKYKNQKDAEFFAKFLQKK